MSARPSTTVTKARPFAPQPWLYQYAYHLARILAENQRLPTQQAMADLVAIRHETVSRALSRPEVHEWLREEIRRHTGADEAITDRIKLRVMGKALQGDLEAARLWFQVMGMLASPTTKVDVTQHTHMSLTPVLIRVESAPSAPAVEPALAAGPLLLASDAGAGNGSNGTGA